MPLEIGKLLKKMRFRNWAFSTRLVVMVLVFTLLPLIGFTMFSSHLFKQYILATAEKELNYITKSLVMLCEAQEALDRLKRAAENGKSSVDGLTGASPNWQDGNEYKSLRAIIKGIRVAKTGYAFVVNSNGNIIIHPSYENRNAADSDVDFCSQFSKMRDIATKLAPGQIETLRINETNPKTHGTQIKIVKFSYFKPYDWIIGVTCYESELMQPYHKTMLAFYTIITLLAISVPLLVFYSAKRMMQPIVQLADAAAKIAKGEYPSIKKLGSKDEIGKLVRSFNDMVAKLQEEKIRQLEEWNRKLEAKVQERTKELEQAYSQLLTMEKLASLGKIASMVAHELNNPMSGILSYARYGERMLRENPEPETIKDVSESLSFIATEAERCGEIVKNLLMFAKRSWGDFKKVHFTEVIERGLKVLEHSIKVHEIQLIKEIGAGNDETWCDPSAMEQVIIGLIVNAIEMMAKGGTIIVRTDYSADDSITFEIEDNGPGIPEDILPHIFEPFVTTKESKTSAGLGLSVVYGIIQAHSGSIRAESKVGKGTKFIVTIPRKPPEEPKIKEGFMKAARSCILDNNDKEGEAQ